MTPIFFKTFGSSLDRITTIDIPTYKHTQLQSFYGEKTKIWALFCRIVSFLAALGFDAACPKKIQLSFYIL